MNSFVKRGFDIFISLIGLILLLFPFLAVAFLIKKEDSEPVFYRGIRVGRHGQLFKIFKFRTMVVNAENMGGSSTANDDIRITSIGRFLRKYKIDELPQLFNVLKGDMSLVGPRPEVIEYVELYNDQEKAILELKPGITDWASLWNSDEGALLAGSKDPEKTYLEEIRPTKLRLQLKYAKEHSMWIDLKILMLTIQKLLLKD